MLPFDLRQSPITRERAACVVVVIVGVIFSYCVEFSRSVIKKHIPKPAAAQQVGVVNKRQKFLLLSLAVSLCFRLFSSLHASVGPPIGGVFARRATGRDLQLRRGLLPDFRRLVGVLRR